MGCALVRRYVARQPMNPPLFCTHCEQHGSSSPPFVRSQPLTLALIPNASSGALHALDADANHGSQVEPTQFHQIVSEALDPSLPAELTLRRLFTGPDWPSLW